MNTFPLLMMSLRGMWRGFGEVYVRLYNDFTFWHERIKWKFLPLHLTLLKKSFKVKLGIYNIVQFKQKQKEKIYTKLNVQFATICLGKKNIDDFFTHTNRKVNPADIHKIEQVLGEFSEPTLKIINKPRQKVFWNSYTRLAGKGLKIILKYWSFIFQNPSNLLFLQENKGMERN